MSPASNFLDLSTRQGRQRRPIISCATLPFLPSLHTHALLPYLMRSFILSFVFVGASLVLAEPTLSPIVLHEKRDHIPHGWTRSRKHHSSAILPLRFGLSQSNINEIESYLSDVSHPDSPNYGKHWTPEQVIEKFAPKPESIKSVKNWLYESGIDFHRVRLSGNKGWLEVNATVAEAESLLNTEYHVYQHETGKEHIGQLIRIFPIHVILTTF